MKIWIWGVWFLIITGCSSYTSNSSGGLSQQSEIEPAAGDDALVSQSPGVDEQPTSSPTVRTIRAELEDYGPAPELTNDTWLSGSQPLRLAELRGKVVLLDMWTFG